MVINWDDIITVFLHDPPDKALAVSGHEQRAARYLAAALGRQVSRGGVKRLAGDADKTSAIAERLPMPSAGSAGERAVNPEPGGKLSIYHPLSGDQLCVNGELDEPRTEEVVRTIVEGVGDPRQRFLALWRLLPERLTADVGPWFARLPAETRVPDHTLWHHADIAARIYAAKIHRGEGALLAFQLGPVQSFVAAARSVRDLWSGSAILSWLTFQAIVPVIERLGPTALAFPSLRGAPLMDVWLRKQGLEDRVHVPTAEALKAPSIPNRFLAVVPWGEDGDDAHALEAECRNGVRRAWISLAAAVRERLEQDLPPLFPDWARRWDDQIANFLDVQTVCLPLSQVNDSGSAMLLGKSSFEEAWPDAGAVRSLAERIPAPERPPYEQTDAGRWQAQVEFTGRLLNASRAVRHIPPTTVDSDSKPIPMKCSLFGSYEQMGPDAFDQAREFWRTAAEEVSIGGVRLGKRDRLCAVALAKRFAAPAFLAAELGVDSDDLRVPDTWTVAAAEWLERAGIDWRSFRRKQPGQRWNGQWLHWSGKCEDADEDPISDEVLACWNEIELDKIKQRLGAPPVYYAILKLDADKIGGWLRGENAPTVEEVLHPKTREYFNGLAGSEAGLTAKRPVRPALHAAISEALGNFAVHVVPRVVAKHHGILIYAGGDDVLALLPVTTALSCVWELRQAFAGLPPENGFADPGYYRAGEHDLLMMGARATLSAGLAVVHAKDDLREGLEAVRSAEKTAKDEGERNPAVHPGSYARSSSDRRR